jgi:hypothetical protein
MAKKSLRSGQRRRNKHWVNVYWPDRAYGGPEEGGWWYSYAEFVEGFPCRSRKQANKLWDELSKLPRYQSHPRYTPSSVNHRLGDTVTIYIENHKGESWSNYRPWE